MPAPLTVIYSTEAIKAANAAFLMLLESQFSVASCIKILDETDMTLASIPLTDLGGNLNVGTGQITLTPAAGDTLAMASGTAAYAQICTALGVPLVALPVQAGVSPVYGQCIISSLLLVLGGPITLISAVIL